MFLGGSETPESLSGLEATASGRKAQALSAQSWLPPPPAPQHWAGRAVSLDCFSAFLKAGEFLLLRLLGSTSPHPVCFGHSAQLAALGNVPGLAEAAGSPA